ncbi:MAG TPA: phosphoribosylformylglycinamidine cyclo-ligase [Actinomycetota bacterium]|nr:phosphoribosylformylglycinamidine cyclo-ligase [Actinomycetota bacterium]
MGSRYDYVGVKGQEQALGAVLRHLGPTLVNAAPYEVLTRFGHYASVLRLSESLGLAVCTDGVGSKTMIAAALDRYDTIGFDCMAMNVNDLLCVGARPVALVDYLGVNTLDDTRTAAILEGLGAAAHEAGVAVVGGELAQLPGIIGSNGSDAGDERAFDLVGTAFGVVDPSRVVLGQDVAPGDVLIGLHSSGIHSNGLSLAHRVLLDSGAYELDERPSPLERSLGDELLEATRLYVAPIRALWDDGIHPVGLVHITGDGFLNLCRLEAAIGFVIDSLPDEPPVFSLIQESGDISDAEMFRVFNMGVGFVMVLGASEVERALEVLSTAACPASVIGSVTERSGKIEIVERGLIGILEGPGHFSPAS